MVPHHGGAETFLRGARCCHGLHPALAQCGGRAKPHVAGLAVAEDGGMIFTDEFDEENMAFQ